MANQDAAAQVLMAQYGGPVGRNFMSGGRPSVVDVEGEDREIPIYYTLVGGAPVTDRLFFRIGVIADLLGKISTPADCTVGTVSSGEFGTISGAWSYFLSRPFYVRRMQIQSNGATDVLATPRFSRVNVAAYRGRVEPEAQSLFLRENQFQAGVFDVDVPDMMTLDGDNGLCIALNKGAAPTNVTLALYGSFTSGAQKAVTAPRLRVPIAGPKLPPNLADLIIKR